MAIKKHEANIAEWEVFFKRCLKDATSFNQFRKEIEKQLARWPLDGNGILKAWAKSHDGGFTVRARLVKYLGQLITDQKLTHADASRVVSQSLEEVMLEQDSYLVKSGPRKGEWRQTVEAVILEQLMTQMVQYRTANAAMDDRLQILRVYGPLINLMSTYSRLAGGVPILAGPALAIGIELYKYVLAYINELHMTGVLVSKDGAPPKELRKGFGASIPALAAIIATVHSDVAENLTIVQRQAGLFESSNDEQSPNTMASNLDAIAYPQTVIDTPLVNTRAALYIYLNAMLTGRPLCDDPSLYTYLNTRYNGTVDILIADLITASFDVLANAINRTESTESLNVYRSFLMNKLPVLLENFSHMLFPPKTIEKCITDPLRRMDSSNDSYQIQSFDPLSSFDMLSDARQEFLFACALYSLIPESSIESILGDVPMQSLPASGKYDRATLVTQCTTNSNRVEELAKELERTEGNSAEVAGALVEIIQTLCAGKDSVTLKIVCDALSRRTQALDVLFLFTTVQSIVQPLCDMLDNWQNPGDQSEHHPVYDEFGSIFLLVLVIRQRFGIGIDELNLRRPESFVRDYMISGCTPLSVSAMPESQRQKLGNWVKSLYDSEGISDESMAACTPKEFHMLVATLFDQTLKASQSGVLRLDTIKGGFEYLLEPFLLPSLITALGWATRVLWTTRDLAPHLDHLLPMLNQLICSTSISPDAKPLHEAVLSVVAIPLERALAHVQKVHPKRRDIDALLDVLKTRIQPPRTMTASHTELENWCKHTGQGALPPTLKQILHLLVDRSATGWLQSAPPDYSHHPILIAVQTQGAPDVLNGLITESMEMIVGGTSQDIILDVVSAFICAPAAPPTRAALSLHDALTLVYEDAHAISETDGAKAEFIVRLQRRVQAQSPPKQESQNALVQDADTVMIMNGDPVAGANQATSDNVDLENIMKGVEGNMAGGDFSMDTGTDGDSNALFGV